MKQFLDAIINDLMSIDGIFFLVAFLASVFSFWSTKNNREKFYNKKQQMPDNQDWAKDIRRSINISYNIFLSLITIFPLIGMFGTVRSLLIIDFSAADNLDGIKGNFFTALASTAIGLILAMIGKIINAWKAFDIEETFEELDKMIDGFNNTRKNKSANYYPEELIDEEKKKS